MITVRACGVGSKLFGRYKETSSTSVQIWIRFETIILDRTRDRDHSTSVRCRFGSKVFFGRYKETSSTSVRICIWFERRDKEKVQACDCGSKGDTIIWVITQERDHSTSLRLRFGSKFGLYKETSTSVRIWIRFERRYKETSTSVQLRFERRYKETNKKP